MLRARKCYNVFRDRKTEYKIIVDSVQSEPTTGLVLQVPFNVIVPMGEQSCAGAFGGQFTY